MNQNIYYIVIGSLASIIVLLVFLQLIRKQSLANKKRAEITEKISSYGKVKDLEQTVSVFVSEIQSVTKDAFEHAQEVIEHLSELVEKAEDQIQRLERQRMISDITGSDRTDVENVSEKLKEFDSKYANIFELYDQGLSLEEIAQKTNMDKGQVELIFNLRRKM